VLFILYSEAASLSSYVVHYFLTVVAGHHSLGRRVSTEHDSDGTHGKLCEETEQVFHQFPKCHLKMLLGGLHDSKKSIRVGTA
jgi:hypothetical protein